MVNYFNDSFYCDCSFLVDKLFILQLLRGLQRGVPEPQDEDGLAPEALPSLGEALGGGGGNKYFKTYKQLYT